VRSTPRRWWLVYAGGSLLVLAGLAWLTGTVLDLERAERSARAEAEHQSALRLGLWRMDSWIGPLFAREATRSPVEYAIGIGDSSPFLRFRFEVGEDGQWTLSPSLEPIDGAARAEEEGLLGELRAATDWDDLGARMQRAKAAQVVFFESEEKPPAPETVPHDLEDQWQRSQREFLLRQDSNFSNNPNVRFEGSLLPSLFSGEATAAVLVPLWLDAPDAAGSPRLVFLRRVQETGEERVQGFLVDWDRLREELLQQVADLFPSATLVPFLGAEPDPETEGHLLASLPARLEAVPRPLAPGPTMTPARVTLAVSWITALTALLAVGRTLRASIDLGERRRTFATTVTHELRSPLTTFRMYSEMLAEGMMPEAKRAKYLATLQRESLRLSVLVENVLAFARLDEGRTARRIEATTARALLDRVLPALERHATAAGVALLVEADATDGHSLGADPQVVEQILFNLVDNATKYGCAGAGAEIALTARIAAGHLELRVRDHGSGVPPEVAQAIFRPFDRGARDASDPQPGIGLGLALARGLARDLGGDLVLEPPPGGGACFRLRLPLSRHGPTSAGSMDTT